MCQQFQRRWALIAVAVAIVAASSIGCKNTFNFFGYQAGAGGLYDPNISTVYVPTAVNRAFQTTPYRGMEVEITKVVVQEIGSKTPFQVLTDPGRADTELRMTLIDISKTVLNRDPQNTAREAEVVITLDVVWWDLRSGKQLSSPQRVRTPVPDPTQPPQPFDPGVTPIPPIATLENVRPVRLRSTGRFIPELGETNSSGEAKAILNMATQIVSMMEHPWHKDKCVDVKPQ